MAIHNSCSDVGSEEGKFEDARHIAFVAILTNGDFFDRARFARTKLFPPKVGLNKGSEEVGIRPTLSTPRLTLDHQPQLVSATYGPALDASMESARIKSAPL